MNYPRISLEQWRTLIAVVDAGSYAHAAQLLNKSLSSVTYALQKLESVLGVKAFEVRGRKAELTATGRLLYRRAQVLLSEASCQRQLKTDPLIPKNANLKLTHSGVWV